MTGRERWYVVHSQPNAEQKAQAHLERQGFPTYLPRFLKRRRHARRVQVVPAALFPRYLFVGIDLETQRWRSIFSTAGVSRLVCHGEQPVPIATSTIDSLRLREDTGGFVRLDYLPNFRTGDKIRILDGAFADCFGLYEGMPDRDRISILLDLLGRKVRMTVGLERVSAA